MIQSLPNEQWKPIKGYEGKYEISNLGRVKIFNMAHNNINSIPDNLKDGTTAILKGAYLQGYKNIGLWKDKKRTMHRVHRLVASAFIPNPDNKPFINHKNGIRDDNRLENLEWCTQSENALHAYRVLKRELPIGGLNSRAILVLNKETGIYYDCIKDAAESLNIKPGNLYRYLNGSVNMPHPFKYAL